MLGCCCRRNFNSGNGYIEKYLRLPSKIGIWYLDLFLDASVNSIIIVKEFTLVHSTCLILRRGCQFLIT